MPHCSKIMEVYVAQSISITQSMAGILYLLWPDLLSFFGLKAY
jgi:hypothetical protein